MPTYQYACTDAECGNRFEMVQSFTDPAASECPVCQGSVRKVYSSVGVVFKGSGFYRTDSRAAAGTGEPGGSGKDSAKNSGKNSGKDSGSQGKGSAKEASGAKAGGGSDSSSGASGTSGKSSSAPSTAAASADALAGRPDAIGRAA